ncbi:hypothetical protein [Cellulomonas sp. Y8]|uniref:hypothetical protein n=1 Tax=Cellulomonas sp. Y8 TaxID=2591145 RepID=UPI003D73BABF
MTTPQHPAGPTPPSASGPPPVPAGPPPTGGPLPPPHDPYAVPPTPPAARPRNVLALLAVVLGACGAALPGLVLAVLGLRDARRLGGAGRGQAWTAVALSVAWGVVLAITASLAPWSVATERGAAAGSAGPATAAPGTDAFDPEEDRGSGAWLGEFAPETSYLDDLAELAETLDIDPGTYEGSYWQSFYEGMWLAFDLDDDEYAAAVADSLACDDGDDAACARVRSYLPGGG